MAVSERERWLEEFRFRPILVGFSGGADSTALLLWLQENGFQVTAVHFEHGLRGSESQAEAECARAFAVARGIPFEQIELHLLPGANLEARAREARLRHWRELAQARQAVIALGHHADDVAENLLLRLGRGSNVSGLVALRQVRKFGTMTVVRPLLGWRREEIEQYLHEHGVTQWNADSSNGDNHFLRNFLRNRLLPAWSHAFLPLRSGLAEACQNLSSDAEYLEKEALAHFEARPPSSCQKEGLARDWFLALHAAMQIRVLRYWLEENGVMRIPDRRLLARMRQQRGGRVPLGNEGFLELVKGFWYFRRGELPEVIWNWRQTPEMEYAQMRLICEEVEALPAKEIPLSEAYFAQERLPEKLKLTGRVPGDRLVAFGETEMKPLKRFGKAEFVLRDENDVILWVPGVRHAEYARVENDDKIVRFRMEKLLFPNEMLY